MNILIDDEDVIYFTYDPYIIDISEELLDQYMGDHIRPMVVGFSWGDKLEILL